jgi:CRISPR-associated endonuclease Csn1
MTWRLGLDIGTNSIGWAALSLVEENGSPLPSGIIATGVRIFSDGRNPKDKQSLAVARRLPRQQRRMRDRYLRRRTNFMNALICHNLMPSTVEERKSLECEDPWALRVMGLDSKLSLHQLGRALFHLQQRRGFKSNRKTDAGGDNESGKIKSAAAAVMEAMNETGARTIGELLATPRVKDSSLAHTHPVRARLKGVGAKAHYDFYPTRDLIEQEFNSLWDAQHKFHKGAMTEAAREELHDILLFQRNLRPQPVGKCSLDPTEERAPKALPSVQRLRIYQEVNHLTVSLPGESARALTIVERDELVKKALGTGQLKFDAARKALKLPVEARFNLESEKRKHLDGDKTAASLASSKRWGKDWRGLSFTDQEIIVDKLLKEEEEDALVEWLKSNYGVTDQQAKAVGGSTLPDGHGQLGRTATNKVLAELNKDVLSFDKAVVAAGYQSHSQLDFDGEVFDVLPYYGEVLERHVTFGTGEPLDLPEKRYGKLANPTVHVALNQIRRVVNDLIKRFGSPSEIVVELARDLPLSAKGKSELDRTQRENQNANDARRKILAELGQSDSYENRVRLRLWEELNPDDPLERRCPYTGEQIGLKRVFSAEVEIEHILPFSRTLDDGIGNKTLSMRHANRFKNQQTPFEAFGSSPKDYDWKSISTRSVNLPKNKSWRFNPDAMDRYNNVERDFLSRQLTDTQYMSRLASIYLRRTGAAVWVTPGRFTSDLRWAWGLNSVLTGHNRDEAVDPIKNRNDHRHHAIDAVVIALTDRGLLQHVATVAAHAEEKFDKRYLANINDPWINFRDTVHDSMEKIIISHRPDHGVQGALHNDTAYGIIEPANAKGSSQVVHRVPLDSLNPKQLDNIRDPLIREHMKKIAEGLDGKNFTNAIVAEGEAMKPPVRKVRIMEMLSVIPTVSDDSGNYIKAYKGDANYCYDIFLDEKGKWTGQVVNRFDANKNGFDPNTKTLKDGTPLVMRVRGNDMIGIEENEKRRVFRVVKFSIGRISLAEHYESGSLKARDADKDDPFKYMTLSPSGLQKKKARLVHTTPAGRVFDPGFKE